MRWFSVMIGLRCIASVLCLMATVSGAMAQSPPAMEPLDHAICRLIESSARANRLPIAFFTRIIWRESSFRAGVVSPAGAEGIAQFMPLTAQERGLANPFDPEQAIPKAAKLLAELQRQFGSLAVAAAAYNAGPARVASWLNGLTELPAETRAYVRLVTARDVEEWTVSGDNAAPAGAAAEAIEPQSCLAVTAALRRDHGTDFGAAPPAPWGVQLAGNFSKARALAAFEWARQRYAAILGDMQPMIIGRVLRSRGTRLFYQVRVPSDSRGAAAALCARIQSIGGNCVALRS
jgi:hypothetical protein